MKTIINYSIIILLLCVSTIIVSQTPPTLPSSGPGGSNAIVHAGFDSAFYGNDQTDGFWLFEPNTPKPTEAYVVVYWHGTASGDKEDIGKGVVDFCAEIVKRGYTVVAPLYQWSGYHPSDANKISHFKTVTEAAFTELDKPGHVTPIKDINGKVLYSVIGYSLGGGTVLIGAANLNSTEIIFPKSITCFAAAGTSSSYDLSGIPAETKVSLQVGAADQYLSNSYDIYWPKLSHIPCENKIILTINSNLGISIPNHVYHTMSVVDANDYYASWKYAVGMADCSLKGTNCEYVLTNRDSITYMGKYSDGIPLIPMTIGNDTCIPIQDTATYLNVDSIITLTPMSSDTILSIETDGFWDIVTQDNWLSLSRYSGKNNFNITVNYDANYSPVSRESYIIITSPEFIVDTVKIVQSAGVISVDVSSITLNTVANSANIITVLSNTVWGITSSDSWISLSTSGGIGDNEVTVTSKTNNPNISPRVGKVTIYSTGLTNVDISVTQDATNTIEEESIQELDVYPNPATDYLTINNISSFEQLQLISLSGQIISSHTINSNEFTLDIHDLQSGLYFINLLSQSSQKSVQFTKK